MTVTASLVVPLTGAPNAALECLVALTEVPDLPTHEVVIVDDASVGLEGLLASVEGGASVVRLPQRSGAAGALRHALGRIAGEICVLLPGMPRVDAGFLAPLCAALSDPGVAAATPGTGDPVAAAALAFRVADLGAGDVPDVPDALLVGALTTRLARKGAVVPVAAARVATADGRSAAARDLGVAAPGTAPELTVVIPTLDAASDRLRRCVAAIQRCTTVPYEIVVVDNGAPPQGFTAPVNSGLRAARGAYAVVCNDDVEVQPGWWEPLRARLDGGAAVAFPLTLDGYVREDFSAWCFAVSRATLEEHAVAPGQFLHPELVVWYQDTDLLQRLRVAGNPPVLVRESTIRHGLSETVATADPALGAWIDRQVRLDHARFVALHGDGIAGAAPAGTKR